MTEPTSAAASSSRPWLCETHGVLVYEGNCPDCQDEEREAEQTHNPVAARVRESIQPTYDHRETGDRFTVETRINGRRLNEITTRDPFVHHRVVIGWRDLLRFVLRGREVAIVVGGDAGIVDDVIELDADALTFNSTRRSEWNQQVEEAMRRV